MPRGYARVRGFRGQSDLRPTLERNDRNLSSFISGYVPSYEEDGTTLILRGDLTLGGSIGMSAGETVDGVDPSAHNHDGMGANGAQVDHGTTLGLGDDDHTHYLNNTRHRTRHSGTSVGRATALTIATGAVFTTIPWTSEYADDDAWHSNATDPERITVPSEGWYLVTVSVAWSGVGGDKQIAILKNGSQVARDSYVAGSRYVSLAVAELAAADDYFTVDVLQTSGGNLDVQAVTPTRFSVVRLA